jgi:predicted amidohydrolase YtcJ
MRIQSLTGAAGWSLLLSGAALAANLAFCADSPGAPARADLLLTNAVVYTLDSAERVARAVAVAGGKIVYAGSAEGARPWRGRTTRVLDLKGKTVLPGLADAHVHAALGEFLNFRLCNVRGLTVEEGFAKVRHCAAVAPPGDWVVGYGWYDLDNPAYDMVTRAQLDDLAPGRKLAVISKDLHTLWANSKTLKEFGIEHGTPSPAGGEIVRDPATGEATGELIDAASFPVWHKIQNDWEAHIQRTRRRVEKKRSELDASLASEDAVRAETDAMDAIDFAGAAIEEAEYAVLDALEAQRHAQELAAAKS